MQEAATRITQSIESPSLEDKLCRGASAGVTWQGTPPRARRRLSERYRIGGILPSRDVAQPGRALAWGARGRQFKSARPDQSLIKQLRGFHFRAEL